MHRAKLLKRLSKTSLLGYLLPILAAVTLLPGCASPLPAPEPVPCPQQVLPPVRLTEAAESPTTRARLEKLLPTISPPASETPKD